MGIKLDGTTGYLELADKVMSSMTGSMLIFSAAQPAGGNPAYLVSQGQSNNDRFLSLWLENDFSAKYYTHRNPGSGASAGNVNAVVPNKTQYRINVGVQNGLSSRRRYYGNSTSGTENTATVTDDIANHNRFTVGAQHYNSNPARFFADGDLAELHTYTTVLTSTDIDDILAGTKKPEEIAGWIDGWTLKDYQVSGNYVSIGGTRTLVASGGVSAGTVTHPVTRLTPGPTISVHPSNQTVTTPATATFGVTAAASGGGTLSYQWQRSTNGGGAWSNVSTGTGGTTNSYTTAATSVSGGNANNADQWRCVVTETGGSNAGSVNSNAATLTVNAAPSGPTINTHPSNQTVTTPATASFSVAATTSGGALSYQWQRSTNGGGAWSNVSTGTGGTTNSYTTAATSVSGGNANNADQYRCAVTDSNGTTNSNAATLTVNAALAGLTSSPLKDNTGSLHLNAPFEAFVLNASTGVLVVRKTSLTSHASTGVITFTDAALAAATQYRVVWRRTDSGAQGVELLTAA